MLVKIGITDTKAWKLAVDTLGGLVPEGVFRFSEKGLEMNVFDASQIVYIEMSVPKDFFSPFEIKGPSVKLPVNIQELHKITSRCSGEEKMVISADGANLTVNIAEGNLMREFKLPLVDAKEEVFKPEPPEEKASFKVSAGVLKNAIKDAGLFSDSLTLIATGDTLVLESKGSGGLSRTVIKEGSLFEKEGEAEAKYSLPYLANIIKNVPQDEMIHLGFSTDSPLRVSYTISGITFSFLLAHMIL